MLLDFFTAMNKLQITTIGKSENFHIQLLHINARHSSEVAKRISSEDMSGLESLVLLAKGAKVMLIMNGATGIVIDIIFKNNQHPPPLPVAVVVQFDDYRGPSFDETRPSCVPICPVTVLLQTESGFYERQQLPLRLAWALTIRTHDL